MPVFNVGRVDSADAGADARADGRLLPPGTQVGSGMAIRRQHIASQLHVLQEAVASAVHELSQPLNVVNLLADNALEDVTTLQAEGAGDPEILGGLRRRVESIIEQSGKASDITRWIRAFAVGLAEEPAEFDPDAVIER